MSIRNTSTKNADGFQYTTHVHQAFNRQPASEQTSKDILTAINGINISGGSIDIATLAKEETLILVKERLNEELLVNTVDISGLALQTTQADLLALAEFQDASGVKINPDHPPLTKYDFTSNSLQMTALGPTTPDLRWSIDVSNGRPGWYFQNSDSGGSNCYWYSNGAGLGNQQVLLYQNFTSFYAVVTIDRTDSVNDAPFIGCYSAPTGSNDIIPTFAHSRWTFSLPGGTPLYSSEQVLIYYGENPQVHSEMRHLPLQLVTSGSNGDRAPTEMIYLITTNTASGRPIGNIKYLLQNAGFTAAGVTREYEFNNSLERKQLANLSATNIPVSVSNFPLAPTSIMVSNFPATQPVSISDAVAISNTSFEVSNFPATQPVSLASAIAISNTSFEVSNFPATQAVSLADAVAISNTSFEVSNFPATQPVSLADAVAISNTSFEISNLPATQAVSIADAVSISNTSFEISNLPATQPVSIADAVTVSGTVAFSNTVIDTHMYAKPVGAPMTLVHCDNNGHLLNGIVDAAENRVTTTANGTKQSLDVNISNLSTNQVQTRALTSSDVVSSNTRSGSGTAITATTVSTKTGLDVNVLSSTTAPVYCTPGVEVGTNVNTGWNNSSLTSASVSTAIDIQWARTVSVLCRASGVGTLVIQVSVDNTNWYTTATTIVLASTSDTVVNYNDVGARYIRLKSNSTVAGVFATISAK